MTPEQRNTIRHETATNHALTMCSPHCNQDPAQAWHASQWMLACFDSFGPAKMADRYNAYGPSK